MKPTIGRFVHYTLTEQDAAAVNQPFRAGNRASTGDVYPMLICRVWGDTPESSVNGQVFLDGADTLWVTSRSVGEGPGHWVWPVIPR